jgi:hypothetical protein
LKKNDFMSNENAGQQNPGNDDNQINGWGKFLAGLLLVAFILFGIAVLLAFWPDKLPASTTASSVYKYRLFHMQLLDSSTLKVQHDSIRLNPTDSANWGKEADSTKLAAQHKDSAARKLADSERNHWGNEHHFKYAARWRRIGPRISLNSLLLILVAAAGFLGNMIHIASSLTSYVGAGKFKRSWILWYFVKPFTAAALAIIIYFVLRAGFLNYSDNANNLNLYGILSLSALAGLFTDMATQKLQEIFEVIFKPKDNRPDKLADVVIKVGSVTPETLDKNNPNSITIIGECFDKKKFSLKIGEEIITNLVIKPNTISFVYQVPASIKNSASTNIKLSLLDEQNVEIFSKLLNL